MQDTRVTVASLRSLLIDPQRNLALVKDSCAVAQADDARMLFLPELMLTGHGAHPKMADNADPVPDGPLSQAIVDLSREHNLCICVGIAEWSRNVVYNSQIVVDKGEYLGLQRKMNLSGDEYCYFGAGDRLETFDIGDIRFGIIICYDNHFPELALLHALDRVDLILSPHAARTGVWPDEWTPEFCAETIRKRQDGWEKLYRARASDHNVYVLANNAVGPSTEGLEDVVANHAGTVFGVAPGGEVFLRTSVSTFQDEIATVTLKEAKRARNHSPARNRRPDTVLRLFRDRISAR